MFSFEESKVPYPIRGINFHERHLVLALRPTLTGQRNLLWKVGTKIHSIARWKAHQKRRRDIFITRKSANNCGIKEKEKRYIRKLKKDIRGKRHSYGAIRNFLFSLSAKPIHNDHLSLSSSQPPPSVTIIIATTTICHHHHHNHHHLSPSLSQPPSQTDWYAWYAYPYCALLKYFVYPYYCSLTDFLPFFLSESLLIGCFHEKFGERKIFDSWFSLPNPTLVWGVQQKGRKRLSPNSSLTIIRAWRKICPLWKFTPIKYMIFYLSSRQEIFCRGEGYEVGSRKNIERNGWFTPWIQKPQHFLYHTVGTAGAKTRIALKEHPTFGITSLSMWSIWTVYQNRHSLAKGKVSSCCFCGKKLMTHSCQHGGNCWSMCRLF